jgi:protein translocase subunit secY/sec61 alpha
MAQGNAAGALAGAGKFTELRQRLLFVLGALIVYRIGCFIPVPGVNPDAMLAMMQAQGGGIVDMFNMFSGGALHRFSIFALNVMPYISASIVMQLGVHIFPTLKALQKEGESGRRKITQYSRIGAVLLAVVQGGSIATALQNQVAPGGMPVVYAPGMGFVLTAVVALTAGTIFLMWLGEQVTERGIGNGVSLIIFAGDRGRPAGRRHPDRRRIPRRHVELHLAADHCVGGAGLHVPGGVRRAWPASYHGELRAPPGRSQRVHEPDLVLAAEAQHGRRDPADLRLQHPGLPGHAGDVVRPEQRRDHVVAAYFQCAGSG